MNFTKVFGGVILYKYLDSNSPVPLYYQLKEVLQEKIDDGFWKQGELIPTENELISYYEVSRTTVREAINELVKEGKLKKKQGKGTTVCKPKIEQVLGRLMGFSERITLLGFIPGAKLIKTEIVGAKGKMKEALLKGKDGNLLYVKRVRLADDEAIAIEETYWPMEVADLFKEKDLSQVSFYPIMEQCGIQLHDAEEVITAGIATPEEASLLQIDSGDPLLRINRVTFSNRGEPIQYCSNHYRSDRYAYKVYLER
jgi:GntR family transcriptional regulator